MQDDKLKWLENPEIFSVNRIPAHSDHVFYQNEEESKTKKMKWKQSLDGVWDFIYSQSTEGESKDFYQSDSNHTYSKIQVPGHIQLQGFEKPQYVNTMYPWDGIEQITPPQIPTEHTSVGRYVRYFEVNKDLSLKSIFLSFQGVETAFYVWVNDKFIGYSEDSFTPSEFDITQVLQPGNNRIAVEVHKRSSASWLEDQDFWRFHGIFREVFLYSTPAVHVRDLFVKAGVSEDNKEGILDLKVALWGQIDECKHAQIQIKDMDGNLVFHKNVVRENFSVLTKDTLPEGIPVVEEEMGFECFEKIPEAILWSGENPTLYQLELTLFNSKDESVEFIPQKIGFRKFEMHNKVMYLNGKRIMFHGVNRHEFNLERGRSITEEDMRWDIVFLKQNNINAVRTSHYPNQSLWYDLCDEYGIYLIDETNLESHGTWQKLGKIEPSINVPGNKEEWKACVVDRANSMFQRDKNHASILMWSCGNESYAGTGILAMADYFRKQDPSRIVHYEGCFNAPDYSDCTDVESRMYAKPADIESYLESNPMKPFISCEYMHTMGNSGGGMVLYSKLEEKYEMYQGGFIWDYIDQAILKEDGSFAYGGDYEDRATDYNFCGNGIVYADRAPSPKVQEVKFLYQNVKVKVEATQIYIKNEFLFDDLHDYILSVVVYKEGVEAESFQIFDIVTKPGEERTFAISFDEKEVTEYVIRGSVLLKSDTKWAKAGFEIAFGEVIIGQRNKKSEEVDLQKIKTVVGDVNIGVHETQFQVLFSKQEGGLVSLKKGDMELITRAPKITFFRAYTDNDKGAGYFFHGAPWMIAGKYAHGILNEWQNEAGELTYAQHLALPGITDGKVSIIYKVGMGGKIFITLQFCGVEGYSHLPAFGMEFKLKKEFAEMTYYGNGPEETYCDRQAGAKLGIYHGDVKDNVSHYLVPQECGNHTGVRYLEVKNKWGEGLYFEGVSGPFEMSVLPYSAMELEEAMHERELGESNYTWVRILACQTGVGGDDSWGAPVHEEYRIPSNKPIEYTFSVQPMNAKR